VDTQGSVGSVKSMETIMEAITQLLVLQIQFSSIRNVFAYLAILKLMVYAFLQIPHVEPTVTTMD
jgi:hypothetical protein